MKSFLTLVALILAASAQVKMAGPAKIIAGSQSQAPQIQTCVTGAFAKTENCSLTVTNGWTILVEGEAETTSAMNAPTMGCGTLTAQTGTTTTNAQLWSIGTATSSGSCTVTQTTSSASNVTMALSVWALSPLVTNGTIDVTVTSSNYVSGFHASSFSGPSVTGVTNNDVYFGTTFTSSGLPGNIIDSTNMPCTSDNSVLLGDGTQIANGHCIVATAGAKAPHWTPGTNPGATWATATIALQP